MILFKLIIVLLKKFKMEVNNMDEDKKIVGKRTRAKKPEIKISLKDFTDLEIYGKAAEKSPAKIVNELIKDFLSKDDVKKIIAENSETAKVIDRLDRKEAKARKMLREVSEERKKYGLE